MKKWIALLLALVMVLSLAACGDDKETPANNDPGNSDAPVEGVLSGRSYVNEFFGFRVDFDAGWSVFDAEATAQLMGTALDNLDLGITLEQTGIITPMYATLTDNMTTVNVAIENTTITAGGVLSESDYAKAAVATLKLTLESMGYSNVTTKTETIDFAGSSHLCVRTQAEIYGMTMYQTQVLLTSGNYMAVVTIGTYDADNAAELLDMFKRA